MLGQKPAPCIGPRKHTLKAGSAPMPPRICNGSTLDSDRALRAGGMKPERKLLIYLTADGLLTDFDLVDD